ncbi:MAG TPA: HNH endonuclease signature motif containing protein [Acidimicrobiia bacterium]|nr:HNH endonuclease signature motif containing protein [Acidimicrobiia bacterium]
MDRWARVVAELEDLVADLEVARFEGRDALRLVRVAARAERLSATAKAHLAQRCVDTGVWSTDREARVPAVTPAEWLADLSGSGIGPAKDALAVTSALHEGSKTDAALRSGELSLTLAHQVTTATQVGGEAAERRVLRKATDEGLRAAKTEAARVLATAKDAAERQARIHRERSRRRWTQHGVWHLSLQGPIALGAEIDACLARFDDAAWDHAATQPPDGRDTPEAIAFDGMLAMARAARDGVGAPTTSTPRGRVKTRDHVVVHVDATALVAGEARPGDRCEVPGLGPVPVEHARSILGDGVLSILVEDGRDVRTFARPGRKVTAALAQLLAARDPVCTIAGCGRSMRIEGDHHRPVSEGGESSAENVDGLCTQHHRRKTAGWTIVEHDDGRRAMEPPTDPARRDRQPAAA